MAMPILLLIILLLSQVVLYSSATIFTLQNNCPYTIWPAATSLALGPTASSGLPSNFSASLPGPPGWSGCLWARTGCLFTSSRTTCATGDSPPFTLAEFTLGQGQDSYCVTLVQGYNVGIGVMASVKECKYAGCTDDMNARCPAELRVEGADGETTVGCKTACQAFGAEEYCCTGKHSTPETCGQTRYSQLFKAACPNAYSYVYDDDANTRTCAAGADYLLLPAKVKKRQVLRIVVCSLCCDWL